MIQKLLGSLALLLLLASCASREKLQYYQGISDASAIDSLSYSTTFKQDDLLLIVVSAPTAELSADFNLASFGVIGDGTSNLGIADRATTQMRYQSYLIDNEGFIEFPVLGRLKFAGLTRSQAMQMLHNKLTAYIKDPIINIRILNYKISVHGEVVRPGTFNIATERITLPEALAMASDLTIYGRRDNILIIREINGKKTSSFVDLTKSDFINSPFYYLAQNDVVYVEPNKTKINSSAVGPNISIILSSVSLLITVIALLTK